MQKEILDAFSKVDIPIDQLRGKKVLVTGASGLIGRMVIKTLEALNECMGLSVSIVAFVRDKEKFIKAYAGARRINEHAIELISGDVINEIHYEGEVDYIIHSASMTQSKSFIENPVEVTMTNINGTKNVLEFARKKKICSIIFLSSMEVYGFTEKEETLAEDNIQYLNPLLVRSCYPESKRMSENLCVSYASEYGVPVKIIRLAQTFGYGVDKADARVFAEFARCAVNGRDIVLLTDGASKRMYLDTIDAVSAILIVLLKGEDGAAYNAANKRTYCSVKEMAEMAAQNIGNGRIAVRVLQEIQDNKYFSPPHRLFLDTNRIEKLGWRAQTDLAKMYKRLAKEIMAK